MRLQEIPALPFALDLGSAAQWLDRLPVANIRECCRLLFPVLQGLNAYPMPPRLRFEIFEQCHPIVLGVARDLQVHFQDKPLPQDAKARKVASLPSRFHFETAEGYRHLLENEASREAFSAVELVLIMQRALEHLSYYELRAAQSCEPPPSSIDSSLQRLYQFALASGLLNETVALSRDRTASIHSLFARAALFRLAVPRRANAREAQRLFDRFLVPGIGSITGEGSEEGAGRGVFYFDPEDVNVLVPAWSTAPPLPGLPFFSPEPFLAPFRPDLRSAQPEERDALARVLSRIGERLPCQDAGAARRVLLYLGFESIASMVREIDAYRQPGGSSPGGWSASNQFELASGETAPAKFRGRQSLANALAAAEYTDNRRRIQIVPSDLPGFYLIDSDQRTLRAGQMVGMNSDGEWIQLAVVRGGQIRDGRFWHSVEMLGAQAHAVKARRESAREDPRPALLLNGDHEAPSLVVPPSKWHCDNLITVRGYREQRLYRITGLLEATGDFCQYALGTVDSSESGALSG